MIVKVLGGIDLFAAFMFLSLIFGTNPPAQFLLFPALLLFVKGMFILSGDILSIFDIYSSILLLLAIFVTPFAILLWISAFFLLSKGVVSFL